MSEVMKDSAIKLFGQTIALPSHKVVSDISLSEHTSSISQDSKDESGEDSTGIIHEYESINPRDEKSASSDTSDDQDSVKKEEEKETTLKKPDKIIPCPRCNSTDTKFCYYNNYNLNQPRHFCKNCQRYWTSGGTMRNVPEGSGRRKNKNITYPHIMVPDAKGVQLKPNAFLISPQGFPVSFYPATLYWGSPKVSPAATSVLGKRSRGGENLDAETTSVLIPKTLRIHDPSEAAKSSVWSTLGIKNQKTGDCLFKAFESMGDNNVDHRTMVLQANPAALCRSINFLEST